MAQHLRRMSPTQVDSARMPWARVVVILHPGYHTFLEFILSLILCLQYPLMSLRLYRQDTSSPPRRGGPCRRLSSPHHVQINLQQYKDKARHPSLGLAVPVLPARLLPVYPRLLLIPDLTLRFPSHLLRQIQECSLGQRLIPVFLALAHRHVRRMSVLVLLARTQSPAVNASVPVLPARVPRRTPVLKQR